MSSSFESSVLVRVSDVNHYNKLVKELVVIYNGNFKDLFTLAFDSNVSCYIPECDLQSILEYAGAYNFKVDVEI